MHVCDKQVNRELDLLARIILYRDKQTNIMFDYQENIVKDQALCTIRLMKFIYYSICKTLSILIISFPTRKHEQVNTVYLFMFPGWELNFYRIDKILY
jgi:hypothetical protein